MTNETMERVKQDFRRDHVTGKPLDSYCRGVGYNNEGERNFSILLIIDPATPPAVSFAIPEIYEHTTGRYPIKVDERGRDVTLQ